jgi:hypothetical protein
MNWNEFGQIFPPNFSSIDHSPSPVAELGHIDQTARLRSFPGATSNERRNHDLPENHACKSSSVIIIEMDWFRPNSSLLKSTYPGDCNQESHETVMVP